jgi:stage V sporulation protein D (sporulation-specific penicillin-binding protein)
VANRAKKEKRFTRKMQIKLLAVFAFILLFLIVLLIRIAYINAKSGQTYAKKVLSQEDYDSRTLKSRRGEIQDANGRIMAYSQKQYNVILDCKEVNSYSDQPYFSYYVDATIKALTESFDLTEAEVRDRIENEATRESQYQLLVSGITESQKEAYEEYVASADKTVKVGDEEITFKIIEAWFEESYARVYPMDSVASTVIGFANSLGDGISGLEAYYDDMLQGTDGRIFGYLNEDQEYQKRTIAPENGYTLQMTIDVNIQQIIEKYIAEFDEEYGDETDDGTAKHGAKNIGVIAMNPNTGAILGMATNSGYDLNNPQDLSAWYSPSELKAMTDEEYIDALNTMWKNFCVTDGYEPGSTVKPISVASALECGAITDADTFICDGGEFITDTTIHCDNIYGHGLETVAEAIKNSCNDALMQIGAKMGVSRFVSYQSLFNFGKRTGIDLPNEATGAVYTQDSMNEVELATCVFGQGFTCTMIQEIAAFCSVVNGGYYYQPHVVGKILDEDGKLIKSMDSLLLKQTISSDVSDLVKGYLQKAVEEGTGKNSRVPGYLTGGKTGTAEKINPETGQRWDGKYVVSFIGAAPINDPQIVIYVVIDEPNVEDQAVSTYAQVIFRKIATEVLPYMNIYPTEEVTDQLLYELGLTRDDITQEAAEVESTPKETFQAFDSYGNIYNDAYVNDENVVVSSSGTPLEGAYVDTDGKVIDGYGNHVSQVEVVSSEEEKVDNPDMAVPPDQDTGNAEDSTLWDPSTLLDDEE